MPKAIVHARASSYRSLGIKLKKMPRKWKKQLDVDALNRLVEELRGPRGGRGAEDDASRGRLAPTALVPGGPADAGEGGDSPLLPSVSPPRPEVVVPAPNDLLTGDYRGPNRQGEVGVLHGGVAHQGESSLPPVMTVKEAALVLRCGLSTLYDMCAQGALESFKLRPGSRKGIRVLTESVVALMARRTTSEPDSSAPAQPKRRPRGSKRLHLPSPF